MKFDKVAEVLLKLDGVRYLYSTTFQKCVFSHKSQWPITSCEGDLFVIVGSESCYVLVCEKHLSYVDKWNNWERYRI